MDYVLVVTQLLAVIGVASIFSLLVTYKRPAKVQATPNKHLASNDNMIHYNYKWVDINS